MKHKKRTAIVGKQRSDSINKSTKTLVFLKVFVNSDYFIPSVIIVLFLILMRIAALTGRLIALINT